MHPSSPRHYPRYCRFSRALDSRARKGNANKALNLSDRCVERRRVERVRKNRRLALRNSHLEMTLQISFSRCRVHANRFRRRKSTPSPTPTRNWLQSLV